MEFKQSTIKHVYTKDPVLWLSKNAINIPVVAFGDTINLSSLPIGETRWIAAIKNPDSFEKQIIANAYKRIA